MKAIRSVFGLAGLLVLAVFPVSAQTPNPPEPLGVRIDVATHLGLDAKRAQQVEAILGAARGKMHAAKGEPVQNAAIRTETETKLASVLTPAEMKRLKAALPPANATASKKG
jgi:hypothetical protein